MKIYRIPQNLKAIIFDIDSTLYTHPGYAFHQTDVQIRHFAQLEGLSQEKAVEKVTAARKKWEREHQGKSLSLGNTFVQLGYPLEESIKWREELLEPERFLRRDEQLITTLAALGEKFRLACVTNNPVLTGRKTLAALGVEEFVPVVIGLDTCKVSKPHPSPFLLASERLSCLPKTCLSVGDRYHIDIELPLRLGMGGLLVDGVVDVYQLPEVLTTGNVQSC